MQGTDPGSAPKPPCDEGERAAAAEEGSASVRAKHGEIKTVIEGSSVCMNLSGPEGGQAKGLKEAVGGAAAKAKQNWFAALFGRSWRWPCNATPTIALAQAPSAAC